MIAIYGGTFNPVHLGHLRVALEIKEIFELDEVRFIPCAQPVLKNKPRVTALIRLKMLQLALAGQQGFVCDNRELERGGLSYMVDTLASLRNEFPEESLILLIGNDAFITLEKWYQWQQLFNYAHIIVMTRPDSHPIPLVNFLKQRLTNNPLVLKKTLAGKLYFQNVTPLAISSTKIRHLLATGRSSRFLIPDNVIDYIQQNKLYRNLNANQ